MHTQAQLLVVAVLLLPQLAATAIAAAAAANIIAKPGCPSKCGKVEIPYPFGLGDHPHCYRKGFEVTCHNLSGGASLLSLGLGTQGPEVLDISVQKSTVKIRSPVRSFNFRSTDKELIDVLDSGKPKPYVFSTELNFLFHTGCGFRAESWSTIRSSQWGYGAGSACSMSPCRPAEDSPPFISGECLGVGCCFAIMPRERGGGLASFRTQFSWNRADDGTIVPVPPSTTRINASLVVVEASWLLNEKNVNNLTENLLNGTNTMDIEFPAILDWSFDKRSCRPAKKMPDYGCISKHSDCHSRPISSTNSSASRRSYTCKCNKGYDGNPYLSDGCQSTTSPNHRHPQRIYIAVGFGIGMGLLLMLLATIYAIKTLKDRKTKKMREYFFMQNRGLLLQQLVDKDIAERMIFSLEELDKATNKFDEGRILGGGGHGTVYKGILSNQHVVAIKKSKVVIQREIDGFINEVAILSQINHRNVVRLFGCCLETEVPLLVYEFISNGTLYDHLHVDAHVSLPWKDRLRIASEVASSLAYLHSEASISIVHRDIKTSNILLDGSLTAKVSDFGASRGISIDKSGVTTAIQGTYGYLDPEYFYTRRLTEKSDVYSYGVMLIELLTRKKPTIDISLDNGSLVEHFIQLFREDRLSEILDVQVIEEGEDEAKQVAAVAVLCLQMKGDDRPTMRHVETILQGIQSSNDSYQGDPGVQGIGLRNTTFEGISNVGVHDNNSRRFSMEREMLLSASFSR